MENRTIARELALLILGQVQENHLVPNFSLDQLLEKSLISLTQHVREALDCSATDLQQAQQLLVDSELMEVETHLLKIRQYLKSGLERAEQALNNLSASLELPYLLMLADRASVRQDALERVRFVLSNREKIDQRLDAVMENWRLIRLPRIDRDILRLASVDLDRLGTPAAVACNEAVEMANRYSDEQGRRMINGILRRLITPA
uniref:Transcription antitermination protein NusB n=1 Tax=Paulinella chromatophora TaxID=39717 RepID=B1X4I0_PAUCH|nr:transcription antitermination protein NusB [Paulinella chromatophora]ACB42849.1 transcription antitermination protein NusB [Paulinella chromatophora]